MLGLWEGLLELQMGRADSSLVLPCGVSREGLYSTVRTFRLKEARLDTRGESGARALLHCTRPTWLQLPDRTMGKLV